MQLPVFVTRSLGWAAFEFAKLQPFIPTYIHLIASALFPIYAGSFSSLSRPSSAAKRKKRRDREGEDIEDDEDEPQKMEGLSPADALMFPLLAGATLTGLYFLIKWLDDPALLNKILNWYFAGFSVFSVSRLVCDGLDVLHSILFPHDFIDQGRLYHVDWRKRRAIAAASVDDTRTSPLPGIFSRLPLPQTIVNLLWTLHVLPNRKLQLKAFIRHILKSKINMGIHGIEGLLVGLSTVIWYNFISKPWWLTNLMGFGFAYGTLQLMSPTTFWTGTIILSGLFFYDIYFVFFTPMMVTVAKSLDIPIKLLFPRPSAPDDTSAIQAMSMLGLGDVVLPGIMIGLALRFDLYMHYLKKQTTIPASEIQDVSDRDDDDEAVEASDGTPDPNEPEIVEAEDKTVIIKAPYSPTSEAWGDHLWTSSLLTGRSRLHGYVARNAFPKPYFHAGLVGYVAGMLVTLGVMSVYEHAQPALLYLVPGVLGSLWGRAWVRGEIGEMWDFSEAAEEEQAKKKEEDAREASKSKEDGKEVSEAANSTPAKKTRSSNSIFSKERNEKRTKRLEKGLAEPDTDGKPDDVRSILAPKDDRTLISFSIALPPPLQLSGETQEGEEDADGAVLNHEEEEISRYNLRSNEAKTPERAEKRQRLS